MPKSIMEPHEPAPPVAKVEEEAQLRLLTIQIHRLIGRIFTRSYDYSTPVDEYLTIEPADTGKIPWQADYDQQVKYETLAVSLPVGTTKAVLTIGNDRIVTLYSGAAITTQQLFTYNNLGWIVTAGDKRYLTLSGAGASIGYLSLSGYAYEKDFYR